MFSQIRTLPATLGNLHQPITSIRSTPSPAAPTEATSAITAKSQIDSNTLTNTIAVLALLATLATLVVAVFYGHRQLRSTFDMSRLVKALEYPLDDIKAGGDLQSPVVRSRIDDQTKTKINRFIVPQRLKLVKTPLDAFLEAQESTVLCP
ncbi:hypothetical protein LTR49_026029 [Elasticomyces elasticus]|nr:hypothetical protein LTR49_026029 [Elasticomyces elasticus]KAK5740846.1 hypothetical protein LTS12_024821 [Elasticomyces elasticus]